MSRTLWAAVCVLGMAVNGTAQQAKTDAEVAEESTKADQLIAQQNFVAALPLYEELHTLRPVNNFYRERLSQALFSAAGTIMDKPEEAKKMRLRARQLLLDAQKSGDNSPYVQVMLEKTANEDKTVVAAIPANLTPAQQAMMEGEKAFANGKLAEAMVQYKKVAELEPSSYEARLFAGDTAYKMKDYAEASVWYAKAIAVNPNRETAHRYWGDSLYHEGKHEESRDQFIEAIIAEPYSNTPWLGLKNWADAQKYSMSSPQIKLPQGPTQDPKKPGNTNITIDPSILGDGGGAAWISYPMSRALWMNEKFKKHFPNEKQYRHSLAEEMDALKSVIAVAQEQKIPESKMDANLKQLIALDQDNMLECWLLLNNADQGLVQDYAAYREKHRDLLHAYIAKYILHPKS